MNDYKAIYARLSAVAGVTALVGARIYPLTLPQNATLPALTYHRIHADSERGSTTDPNLRKCIMGVTAWGKTHLDAVNLAAAANTALDRWRQVTVNSVAVDDCFFQSSGPAMLDPVTQIHYMPAEYRLHYRE